MSRFFLRDLRPIAVRFVFAVSISMLCVAGSARAGLVINLTNGGGTAPANMAGGGDLMTIAAEAAGVWERAFANTPELWVLNLSIGWDDLALGNGQFDQTTQGGNPNRIDSGRVRLNNSGNVEFFADPTPWDDVEYGHYETYDRDFGTGLINIGREFSDPTGNAVGRVDLLTIVLHEIGHGLGLNSDYEGYQEQRDSFFLPIEPPTPFASFYVQLGISDHLFDGDFPNALMIAIENPGVRKRVSGLDILANAQLSRVVTPNLDPYAVPEPATWVLTGLAMIAMAMHRGLSRNQAISE
jgi:hypothetical protein